MAKKAKEALIQIDKMNYEDEFAFSGIDEVLSVAVVLCGKSVEVKAKAEVQVKVQVKVKAQVKIKVKDKE